MPQFRSFGAMADHFAQVVARMPTVKREALTTVGIHIQTTAKAKLGDYQPAAGPFAAWAPLAETTLSNKQRQAYTGGKESPELVTGAMRDSIMYRVVGSAVHIGSDDAKVDYQERGTDRILPRSFLGSSLFEQQHVCVSMFTARIRRLIETGQ